MKKDTNISRKLSSLRCPICSSNPIDNPKEFNVIWEVSRMDDNKEKFIHVYVVCKKCDYCIKELIRNSNHVDQWDEFSDFFNPKLWINKLSTFIYDVYNGKYSETALNEMHTILVSVYPYVYRELTEEEKQRYEDLQQFGFV